MKLKVLSRKAIEEIATDILTEYRKLPEIQGRELYNIDTDILLTRVLGLNIEYAHLSPDESVLGLTSFDEISVLVYDDSDTEYLLCLDGKTVAVEKELLSDIRKRGRCNFTKAHEGAHQAFKMIFPKDYGVVTTSDPLHFYKKNTDNLKPIQDWEEWQANTLASALLLPNDLVKKGMFYFGLGDKISFVNRYYNQDIYNRFSMLADYLGVSKKALAIRMKYLGLLGREYLDNPTALLDVCGGAV